MKDDFACLITKGTHLEAYIGRRDQDAMIEIVIEDALQVGGSVCLNVQDARALAATLENLADRLERHLAKG